MGVGGDDDAAASVTSDPRRAPSDGPVFPAPMPEPPAPSWTVGVVTDTAAPRADQAAAESGIGADAEMIARHSGLRCVPLPVSAASADELAATLHDLPLDVGAIFLTRTESTRAREAQRILAERGGRPLITDDDARAIVLTTAVGNYLSRLHRPVTAARVVIAGAATVPVMCPLLLTAGMVNITLWKPDLLKMACFFCKEHIEFSTHAIGEKMPCPHCKMDITLKEQV